MHEHEQSLANQYVENGANTESFVLGDASEADIKLMRDQGLIVQEMVEDTSRNTPGNINFRGTASSKFSNRINEAPVGRVMRGDTDDEIDLFSDQYYIIRISGPMIYNWLEELKQINVELLEYIPTFKYKVLLSLQKLEGVRNLSFVKDVSMYDENDTGIVTTKNLRSEGLTKETLIFDLRLHQNYELDKVLDWLKEKEVKIEGHGKKKIRVHLEQDSPLFKSIARLTEVATVEEYIEPKLFNDRARILMNLDSNNAVAATDFEFKGQNQIVAVADTGIDDQHPDFQNRIDAAIALGRNGDFSDPNGHGTHVSGSVIGDGAASNGTYRGVAPKSKLIFQSLMDSNGSLSGIPLALEDLFEEAYNHGARIHNNSWGAATSSKYTVNSIEVDEYVSDKKDMLILIAAGNEGTANSPLHSAVGFVDWLSIGSPASSKNSLTVGASRSDRTQGGLSQLTYSQAWPGDFPDLPIANQKISGRPNGIAGFSSRGPCDDQRIKPDVVAPGTDIISTKSSLAPNQNFWGNVSGNNNYAYMGGTSMACPLVSGCAALIREYYDTIQNYQEPSAALIKATLNNGAQKLSGSDSIADHDATPNYHQGFGRIDMAKTIPNQQNPTLQLKYIDSWKNDNLKFTRSGERFRFIVDIGPDHPLRICLAYTDIPGRALQNNINLFVECQEENGPTFKTIGNQEFRVLPGNLHIPDPDNNVEVVRMASPNKGRCLIQLTASNLLKIDQDFALIVTGDLRSNLIQS
jgi:subtilisin family serine protease